MLNVLDSILFGPLVQDPDSHDKVHVYCMCYVLVFLTFIMYLMLYNVEC